MTTAISPTQDLTCSLPEHETVQALFFINE